MPIRPFVLTLERSVCEKPMLKTTLHYVCTSSYNAKPSYCKRLHKSYLKPKTAWNTLISPNFLVWKLCLSTKFPYQEIRWNYGILRIERYGVLLESLLRIYFHRNFDYIKMNWFLVEFKSNININCKLIFDSYFCMPTLNTRTYQKILEKHFLKFFEKFLYAHLKR